VSEETIRALVDQARNTNIATVARNRSFVCPVDRGEPSQCSAPSTSRISL
jgi:hypothetical protein